MTSSMTGPRPILPSDLSLPPTQPIDVSAIVAQALAQDASADRP